MSLTPEHIAAAQTLLGLDFTPAQNAQMLEIITGRREQYAALRSADLPNSIPLTLNFNVHTSDPVPAPVPRTYALSAQPPVSRPADLEDAAFYSVTQLAQLIRTRQVTSLELTEMYLARLKRYDETLLCVAAYTEDLAIAQAQRADAEIARGLYRGPLHGIPWGAKDLLATRGYPTQWGAAPYRDQQIDLDATVVQRLEAAGAVLIAKLTLGALANGDVWYGGMTRNPWDTDEGSSGSSAGSGAAVAAGLVGFAIGTETLGSIVSPSTRCGVSGLRPTYGRVSRYGAYGAQLEQRQDRAHVPLGRRLRPGFQRHLRSRWLRHDHHRPSPLSGIRRLIPTRCASAMSRAPSSPIPPIQMMRRSRR